MEKELDSSDMLVNDDVNDFDELHSYPLMLEDPTLKSSRLDKLEPLSELILQLEVFLELILVLVSGQVGEGSLKSRLDKLDILETLPVEDLAYSRLETLQTEGFLMFGQPSPDKLHNLA